MKANNYNPIKRNKMVGFKISEGEKAHLEKVCKKRGTTLSRFIRHAVNKEVELG